MNSHLAELVTPSIELMFSRNAVSVMNDIFLEECSSKVLSLHSEYLPLYFSVEYLLVEMSEICEIYEIQSSARLF